MALCMADQYFKCTTLTTIQLGTCAMKPREEGGVVDARLNVYGTQNLKVAGMSPSSLSFDDMQPMDPSDCSIPPANVGANTYNTALAIGEKAAVIIAQDLGIKGVESYIY